MEIRYATMTEKQEIRSLWNYCFMDTERENEFYFSSVYDENNTLVAIENHTIAAALQMNRHVLHVGAHIHDVRYIVGVSVRPEYRGKGFSNRLMHYCLQELTQQGDSLVLLMPIDTSIYRRYGFINVFFQSYTSIALKDLQNLAPTTYQIRPAHRTLEDAKILTNLYQKAMEDKHGFIQRGVEKNLRKMAEVESSGGQTYLIFDENGTGAGSFFFFLSSTPEGESLVDEFIFFKKNALGEMLRFCKGHQTQTQKINVQAVDHPFFLMALGYDNRMKTMQKPFLMARSLSPMPILQNMFFGKDLADFLICVKGDALLMEDRLFWISPQGFTIKKKDLCLEVVPDITTTQEGLILWYMQGASLKTLEDAEEIFISDPLRSYFIKEPYCLNNYANEYI